MQNRDLHKNGYEVLSKFHDLMNMHGIRYWLTAGTLLGIYREKKFIGHDLDIDVAVRMDDFEKVKSAIKQSDFNILSAFGSNLDSVTEICISLNNVRIDIFLSKLVNHQEEIFVYFAPPDTKKIDIPWCAVVMFLPEVVNVVPVEIYGYTYMIPENAKEYLPEIYGPDFMVPNAAWTYTKHLYNAKYFPLDEVYGIRTPSI